jgi:hypothetical protein
MEASLIALGTAGLLAGAHHAGSGPDHLAGVAPLVSSAPKSPWRVGLHWGLGHTVGALCAAALALALREQAPGLEQTLSLWSERIVGLVLCIIGALGLRAVLRRHDLLEHSGRHRSAFGLGLLHGAAGLAHLFAVLPALALPGVMAPSVYLGGYALGSLGAITIFAALLGQTRRFRASLALSSGLSVLVGLWWLLESV